LDNRIAVGLEIPVNQARPITATTDVVNDYFIRDENPGFVTKIPDGYSLTTRRCAPASG
jgi:hypothetical protein